MAGPRKYPLELRERAVRLWRSEQPRRPIAHVARELGIHPEVLRTWIRRDQADHGERTVVVRLRWHQPTRDYLVRRTKEGLSKREIIRCLKRYVAREVFAAMTAPAALPDAA